MRTHDQMDGPVLRNRCDPFFDRSVSWTVDVRESRNVLSPVAPVDISPDPGPQEAYRARFRRGIDSGTKSTASWSDSPLDQFGFSEATAEVEAIAKALGHIGSRAK